MSKDKAAEIIARQLAAEAGYVGALASNPRIRMEHRRILADAERELTTAVAEILASGALAAAPEMLGAWDGGAGLPDEGRIVP